MKTIQIEHPVGDPFIRVSAWQVSACDGDHCAAALLSHFERLNGAKDQSAEQLKCGLLGLYSADAISASVRKLQAKGFLRVFKNPEPRYAFDRTLHFEFLPEAVNEWIKTYKPTEATCRTQPPQRNIYLMRNSRNRAIKIGIAKLPPARERTLQAEEPDVALIAHWPGRTADEKALHEKFQAKRLRGEWFNLSDADVESILQAVGNGKATL